MNFCRNHKNSQILQYLNLLKLGLPLAIHKTADNATENTQFYCLAFIPY